MLCRMDFLHLLLQRMFTALARVTTRHPWKMIAIPLCVTAVLTPGLLRASMLEDAEYQYTPTNGRTTAEREIAQQLFPLDYSHAFSPMRQIKYQMFGRFLVTARDGGSVLRPEVWADIELLNEAARNLTVRHGGEDWRFDHLCARTRLGRCNEPTLLALRPDLEAIQNGDYRVHFPVDLSPDGKNYRIFAMALGGVDQTPDGAIKAAEAAVLNYFLDASNRDLAEINDIWEDNFLSLANILEGQLKHANLFVFLSKTINSEFNKDTVNSMKYFIITIFLMLTFSVATSLMSDCVRSKPWYGILGCISTSLAVGSAMGLLLYCGLEFVSINLVVPFLLLGIGLDDTFVLLAAWRRTDPTLPLEKRVEETYQHAGVSITVTSLTNTVSFLLGATSPFRATNILCLNASVSVIFTYSFQLCFFGGCMVLLGRAEEHNLHSITWRQAVPKSLSKHHGTWFRLFCTGGRDHNNPLHPEDNAPHMGMLFFRDQLGGMLSHPVCKAIVLILFVAYFIGGCLGCMHLREGMNMDQIFGMGTYGNKFAQMDIKYFYNYLLRFQLIIDYPLDYSDPKIQRDVERSFEILESLPKASNSTLNEYWLKYFLRFINGPSGSYIRWRYNLTNEQDFIYCLRTFFFKHPMAKDYESDVVFNENYTKIIASRFFYQTEGVADFLDGRDNTVSVWNVMDSLPIKMFIYHPYMKLIEIQISMATFTLKTVAVTAMIMMFITIFFIPKLICSIWVFFTIVSIEVGVLGYMTLWGVNINPASMVALVVSVGFSVDNAAHITYAFMCSKMKTPNEKMKDALYYVGLPVSQASISTIIGVAVLPLTPSYNFHIFFKTITLLMLFAMAHSIVLLPILLSITDAITSRNSKSKLSKNIIVKSKTDIPNDLAQVQPFIS